MEKVIMTMPLVKNIGYVNRSGWELVKCPVCKEECYKRELPKGYEKKIEVVLHMCTLCALKHKPENYDE